MGNYLNLSGVQEGDGGSYMFVRIVLKITGAGHDGSRCCAVHQVDSVVMFKTSAKNMVTDLCLLHIGKLSCVESEPSSHVANF